MGWYEFILYSQFLLIQKLPIADSDRVASSRSDRTIAVACSGLSGSGVGQARASLGLTARPLDPVLAGKVVCNQLKYPVKRRGSSKAPNGTLNLRASEPAINFGASCFTIRPQSDLCIGPEKRVAAFGGPRRFLFHVRFWVLLRVSRQSGARVKRVSRGGRTAFSLKPSPSASPEGRSSGVSNCSWQGAPSDMGLALGGPSKWLGKTRGFPVKPSRKGYPRKTRPYAIGHSLNGCELGGFTLFCFSF